MKVKEILIVIFVVFLDLITKFYVSINSNLHSLTIIDKFFYITYAKNTGAAWSILEGQQILLSVISFIAIVYMVYYLFKNKLEKPFIRYFICLMMAGAIGNFIDRIYLGYVRDFLHFYIFNYSFPIFNVADMALCIGVFLLFLYNLKEVKDGKA